MVNFYPLDLFDAVEVRWAPNDSSIIVWDSCINYRLLAFNLSIGLAKKY